VFHILCPLPFIPGGPGGGEGPAIAGARWWRARPWCGGRAACVTSKRGYEKKGKSERKGRREERKKKNGGAYPSFIRVARARPSATTMPSKHPPDTAPSSTASEPGRGGPPPRPSARPGPRPPPRVGGVLETLGDVLGPPDGRAGSAVAAPAVTGVEGNGDAGAPRLRASRASRTDVDPLRGDPGRARKSRAWGGPSVSNEGVRGRQPRTRLHTLLSVALLLAPPPRLHHHVQRPHPAPGLRAQRVGWRPA